MGIGHESSGVRLDLADVEAFASILLLHDDTGHERTLQAAGAVADEAGIVDLFGVGERYTRRPRGSERSLVDVRGCGCGRLEFALEVVQGDVVADHVGVGVDAKVEDSRCARNATGRRRTIDDVFGKGVDRVRRCEVEEVTAAELVRREGILAEVDIKREGDVTVAALAAHEVGEVQGSGGCAECQTGDGSEGVGNHIRQVEVEVTVIKLDTMEAKK
jgi:hypothetical protein